MPKNRGRKLNYPKQQRQQQQQRDGYRSENKTIKGTQKRERIKVEESTATKKKKKKTKRLQSQMKISKPKGHLQLTVISSTLLALPCPCHINHISHATLCPLMSMPDICHGPWPMSYYLHNNPPLPNPLTQRTDQGVSLSLLPLSCPHCVVYHSADLPRLK